MASSNDTEPPFVVLGPEKRWEDKMAFRLHKYTHIIVGKEKTRTCEGRRQFAFYVRVLKELNLEVIEVDFGVAFPYNVFLEDLAIVCNGTALLLKPTTSEEKEVVKILRNVLEKDLGQTIIELTDPNAQLAGSDVLFTGREFFVGICETSNEAGAKAVAEAFPEFPCTLITMPQNLHHLKKYVTVAGPDILCVASSDDASDVIRRLERDANYIYKTLTVVEEEASNCVFVNGTLFHRAIEEIPKSFKIFCERIDYARRSIYFPVLAMMSNGLSACVLLVRNN